jgi:hypothetical protein
VRRHRRANRQRTHLLSFHGTSARFEYWFNYFIYADGGAGLADALEVDIINVGVFCPRETPPGDYDALSVVLLYPSPDSVTTGTYALGPERPPPEGNAVLDKSRGAEPSHSLLSTSGQMVLSRLTSSEAQGSVDVSLNDGTRLRGDFSARFCPLEK